MDDDPPVRAVESRTPSPAALPAWARALDWVTLGLAALAVLVLLTGGFRLHLGEWRLSLTSAGRLVAWAVLAGSVRHLRIRTPTLLDTIRAIAERVGSEPIRTAWQAALVTRTIVPVLGLLAVFAVGYPASGPGFRLSPDELINLPARWDAGWYLQIAAHGYRWDPDYRMQQNVAFFPALPMLMRAGGRLLGGDELATLWAGVLISNAVFVMALVYLFRLARAQGTGDERGALAVWLVSAYPFAVFFGAVYTEALFLLSSVAAFWHASAGRWGRVAVWGLLAGLTRPNGAFLSVPLAYLACAEAWRARTPGRPPFRRLFAGLAASAAPGLGLLLFSAWMFSWSGNAFAWAEVQVRWGRTVETTVESLTEPFEVTGERGLIAYLRARPGQALDTVAAAAALLLTVPIARRLGVAYGLLMAMNLVVPLALGGTLSMARMTSTMFPLFLYLAAALPLRAWLPTAVAFGLGQGFMAVLFYTWRGPF
jgi:Mannosyltransferase (PIG-V)